MHLAEQEHGLVAEQLQQVFGYHLLQLGVTRTHPMGDSCDLGHHIYAAPGSGESVGLLSEHDSLPFASDSIDAVVLHHALEFSENPHALLREAHRVVTPQGYILVIGFNPVSLHGARVALQRFWPRSHWQSARPMSAWRLRDWLRLLGADVRSVRHTYILPPFGGDRVFGAMARADRYLTRHNWHVGGVYAMLAQKQVFPLTPSREKWQRSMSSKLIDLTVPRPVPSPRDGEIAA